MDRIERKDDRGLLDSNALSQFYLSQIVDMWGNQGRVDRASAGTSPEGQPRNVGDQLQQG